MPLIPSLFENLFREVFFRCSCFIEHIIERLDPDADFISCRAWLKLESENFQWMIYFKNRDMFPRVKFIVLSHYKEYADRLVNVWVSPVITPSTFDLHDQANLSNTMLHSIISEEVILGAELLTALEFRLSLWIFFVKKLLSIPTLDNHGCFPLTLPHVCRVFLVGCSEMRSRSRSLPLFFVRCRTLSTREEGAYPFLALRRYWSLPFMPLTWWSGSFDNY